MKINNLTQSGLVAGVTSAAGHIFGCCGGAKIAPFILPALQAAGVAVHVNPVTFQMAPYVLAPFVGVASAVAKHRRKSKPVQAYLKTAALYTLTGIGFAAGLNGFVHGHDHAPQGDMQGLVNADQTTAVFYKRDTTQFFLSQHRFLTNSGDIEKTETGIRTPVTEIPILYGLALQAQMAFDKAIPVAGTAKQPLTFAQTSLLTKIADPDIQAAKMEEFTHGKPLVFSGQTVAPPPVMTASIAPLLD